MKKLTAGIFTALLGLVTVNAANAAIPSTTYVDNQITAAQTAAQNYADTKDAALKTAYEAADATLKSAYEAADEALDGRVDTLETTVGSGDMTVNGAAQADVIAAINALDAKTNGIATNENLDKLQQTVTTHTNSLNVLNGTGEGSVAKAEADAKAYADGLATNYDAAGAAATAESNAKAYADGLASNYDTKGSAAAAEAAAKSYADGLASNYDAAGSAAAAETSAKAYAESEADAAQSAAQTYAKNYADGLATNYDAAGSAAAAETRAKAYADQAEADAIASAKSYADTELAKKVDKTGHTASQVVVTDSTGAIATAAQIPNTQVSGLGDLATKSTIANADVAADAAIAQSKIAGLEDALANTTPKVTARGEAGTYVLTAIVSDSGATSYQWEQISRPTTGGEG